MQRLLDALDHMKFTVASTNFLYVELVRSASELREGEPFPLVFLEALTALWNDPSIQAVLVWERQNEDSLPDKCVTQYANVSFRFTY
jgi:guanine nucleotide-binding protein subunit alpha